MEKKQKDFSELDDLCFANGWDLQEMIEWNDELLKEILAYFIKSGFNLPMMRYALTYLTQCFMNHASWFIHPDDYYEFSEEHGKELSEIAYSTLERIQEEAEEFYGRISGGSKSDWK